MTTQAIMLTEMQADLQRTATSAVTAMRNKIAAAIRFYQPHRFYFNESRTKTFNTVSTTSKYSWTTIGTEFYTIDGAFVTDSSNVLALRKSDYLEFETPNTGNARPDAFAFIDGGLAFWPIPNDAYSIRLTGHIKAAAPATDDEASNPWMVEAYDLIMSRAKAELYAHRWFNPTLAQVMQEAESLARSSLRSATTSKVATGSLMPTEF